MQTQAPAAVAFASPPSGPAFTPLTTWVTYKTQIQFAFALLAFLMVLVGAVTVVEANADVSWKYYVALIPVLPAGLVIWLFVRALSRLDECSSMPRACADADGAPAKSADPDAFRRPRRH